MKTSLTRTKQIERYLLRQSTPEESLLFEAQSVLDPVLRDDLRWQQKTYDLVRQHGRRQLLGEIEATEHLLFHSSRYRSFQRMIRRLFA